MAILNSNLYALFAELAGQKGLGEGANAIMVYDLERLPVIDVSKLDKHTIKALEKALDKLSRRDIGTVLEEINANDHMELDVIVFDILGLTQKEIRDVYFALKDLVIERTTKAKSVKRNGNGNGKGKKKKLSKADYLAEQQTLSSFVF